MAWEMTIESVNDYQQGSLEMTNVEGPPGITQNVRTGLLHRAECNGSFGSFHLHKFLISGRQQALLSQISCHHSVASALLQLYYQRNLGYLQNI